MFERGDIPSCDVLLADSGYDCRGNEEIAVFKPIRRGSCCSVENLVTNILCIEMIVQSS